MRAGDIGGGPVFRKIWRFLQFRTDEIGENSKISQGVSRAKIQNVLNLNEILFPQTLAYHLLFQEVNNKSNC